MLLQSCAITLDGSTEHWPNCKKIKHVRNVLIFIRFFITIILSNLVSPTHMHFPLILFTLLADLRSVFYLNHMFYLSQLQCCIIVRILIPKCTKHCRNYYQIRIWIIYPLPLWYTIFFCSLRAEFLSKIRNTCKEMFLGYISEKCVIKNISLDTFLQSGVENSFLVSMAMITMHLLTTYVTAMGYCESL